MLGVGIAPFCHIAIWSLQGYPGELVQSSSMDITLDDVLTILDEHYNNVKALDALNQELFQLRMADKETVSDWGVCPTRHLQVLAASFPDHFPPDWVAELKRDCFYGSVPKHLKAMVAYLKAGLQVRTYSDYLRAAWEAEKEDSMELPRVPRTQNTDNAPKPWASPCRNSRATSPPPKHQQCIWHIWRKKMLGEMRTKRVMIQTELKGLKEEFMVCLARAVKDTQAEEKCCYHCSSPEHFIHNCLLIKILRENAQLNSKEGMASKKEPRHLWQRSTHQRTSRQRFPRCKATTTDSLLESRPLLMLAWSQKCNQSEDKWGKLHSPAGQ